MRAEAEAADISRTFGIGAELAFYPQLLSSTSTSSRRYLSVALSVGLPRLAVSKHCALRSPDFPQVHASLARRQAGKIPRPPDPLRKIVPRAGLENPKRQAVSAVSKRCRRGFHGGAGGAWPSRPVYGPAPRAPSGTAGRRSSRRALREGRRGVRVRRQGRRRTE